MHLIALAYPPEIRALIVQLLDDAECARSAGDDKQAADAYRRLAIYTRLARPKVSVQDPGGWSVPGWLRIVEGVFEVGMDLPDGEGGITGRAWKLAHVEELPSGGLRGVAIAGPGDLDEPYEVTVHIESRPAAT